MTDVSWLGPAIDIRPVLAEQQQAFVDLLRELDADVWDQPTICAAWSVKDVRADRGRRGVAVPSAHDIAVADLGCSD